MAPTVSIGGIHLINSTGSPVAGGSATAASTTPFSLGPGVQLDAAPPLIAWSGGAPFTLGASPVYAGYDAVTVTWPCNVQGSSHEDAVAKLQQLKLALGTTLFSTAPLLAIQPTSSSTIMYAEVLSASVQERPVAGLIPIEGGVDLDFDLTFTRRPFFTPSGLTTLLNAVTYTNTGTGANNNTQSLGSPAGDLIYEGQPLNLTITPIGATSFDTLLAATVYQRTYTTLGTTITALSTQAWILLMRDTTSGLVNPARTRNGLRARVLLRVASMDSPLDFQARLLSRVTGDTLWTGPIVTPANSSKWTYGATGTNLKIDVTPQGIPLDAIRRAGLTSGDVDVAVYIRSREAVNHAVTNHSMETLLYYTYCLINVGKTLSGTTESLRIEQAQNLNGTAYQPSPGVALVSDLSGGQDYLTMPCDVRGTLPLAISGASLYLSWSTFLANTITHTATVSASHLPLYRTLRGNG